MIRRDALVFETNQMGICYSYSGRPLNLDVSSQRIDAQKFTHGTLQDTKENVWSDAYNGLQIYMLTR